MTGDAGGRVVSDEMEKIEKLKSFTPSCPGPDLLFILATLLTGMCLSSCFGARLVANTAGGT